MTMAAPEDPAQGRRRARARGGRRRAVYARARRQGRRASSPSPTSRRGAAAASSASTPTATSWRSSSPHEGRRPARPGRRPRRGRAGSRPARATRTRSSASTRPPSAAPTSARSTGTSRASSTGRSSATSSRARSSRSGAEVSTIRPGDRVVNMSLVADGTCAACRAGRVTQCSGRALFGYSGVYPRLDGAQAELVRVPHADTVLSPLPDSVSDEAAVFLADNLPTGLRRGRPRRDEARATSSASSASARSG